MQRLRLHGEAPNGTVFQTRQGLATNGLGTNGLETNGLETNGLDEERIKHHVSDEELSHGHGDVVGDRNEVNSPKPVQDEEDPAYKK